MKSVHDKEIEVTNLKEHIRTLKTEIQDRNILISGLSSQIKIDSDRLSELESKISSRSGVLDKLHNDIEVINVDIKNKLDKIKELDSKLIELDQSLITQSLIKSSQDDLFHQIQSDIEYIKSEKQLLLDSYTSIKIELETKINALENLMKELDIKKESKQSEILDLEKKLLKYSGYTESQISILNKQLDAINEEILNSKELIAKPFELILKREKELKKKEKNFEIIFQRFNRIFKKKYPDSEIII